MLDDASLLLFPPLQPIDHRLAVEEHMKRQAVVVGKEMGALVSPSLPDFMDDAIEINKGFRYLISLAGQEMKAVVHKQSLA